MVTNHTRIQALWGWITGEVTSQHERWILSRIKYLITSDCYKRYGQWLTQSRDRWNTSSDYQLRCRHGLVVQTSGGTEATG